ncbi:hypothetical protein Rru_A2414 [Rhodospirillum rubrum ATCC 11170]|uniref:Uncharacterized protein n=3 Tax=Rhodospirillum rubrum TaxID=1085 RepID=Q2RRN1_RHORT|nr:hypothetical protein Rru_A2414 [Rhodospirillum rubrum ATCC 11170]MBK5954848.1 hypothetical protein [Rhodospirillum rubrum]HAQ00089.1 hypothetical protein [Rhodospirillum rubrum]
MVMTRSLAVLMALPLLLAAPLALAQDREALMEAYRAKCDTEARRAAALPNGDSGRGRFCDDLARQIQHGAALDRRGAQSSPLARPNATVWPEEDSTPKPPIAPRPTLR